MTFYDLSLCTWYNITDPRKCVCEIGPTTGGKAALVPGAKTYSVTSPPLPRSRGSRFAWWSCLVHSDRTLASLNGAYRVPGAQCISTESPPPRDVASLMRSASAGGRSRSSSRRSAARSSTTPSHPSSLLVYVCADRHIQHLNAHPGRPGPKPRGCTVSCSESRSWSPTTARTSYPAAFGRTSTGSYRSKAGIQSPPPTSTAAGSRCRSPPGKDAEAKEKPEDLLWQDAETA